MTNFTAWAKLCYETNIEIWPISVKIGYNSIGLYMTKGWHWDNNHRNIYYDNPVYHVWLYDERELVTMNADEATKYWMKLVKEFNFKVENFEQIDMEV